MELDRGAFLQVLQFFANLGVQTQVGFAGQEGGWMGQRDAGSNINERWVLG